MGTQNRALVRTGLAASIAVISVALAMTAAASDNAVTQTIREQSVLARADVPPPVRGILERACQDCHSENTRWPWYSRVPLISKQIQNDVTAGRAFMDLSRWNAYSEGEQHGFRVAIGSAVQNHQMPPAKYVWMHHEARLSSDEIQLVKAWAFAPRPNQQ
jgi:hypothetical protein